MGLVLLLTVPALQTVSGQNVEPAVDGRWSDRHIPTEAWADNNVNDIEIHPISGDTYIAVQTSPGVLRWTGEEWEAVGGGTSFHVFDIAFADDGTLYAVGRFSEAGGIDIGNHAARWDGTQWHPLGQGLGDYGHDVEVHPGTGDVYVVGRFGHVINADGTEVSSQYAARWDGTEWHALGGGVRGRSVNDVAIDPTTNDVYFGGYITGVYDEAGEVIEDAAHHVLARWTDDGWDIAAGMDREPSRIAFAADGTLYLGGGSFGTIDTVDVGRSRVVRRTVDGLWEPLGGAPDGSINELAVDPATNQLYVGGRFEYLALDDNSTAIARHLARWDPQTRAWSTFGPGIFARHFPSVEAFGFTDEGVALGGNFSEAGGRKAGDFALWTQEDVAYASVPVTFRVDMRQARRLGIFEDRYTRRPAIHIANGERAGRYFLYDADGDTTWSAQILQPAGTSIDYSFALDLNNDGADEDDWIYELEGPGSRQVNVTAGAPPELPIAFYDDLEPAPVDGDYEVVISRAVPPGNPDPISFDDRNDDTHAIIDFEQVDRASVAVVHWYTLDPGGAPPQGIFNVAQSAYWQITLVPDATDFDARATFSYEPFTGVTEPADLRLLRRESPTEPWEIVSTELDLNEKTLSAPGVTAFSQWTLGSVTSKNVLTDAPPGLVSNPNPPDGELQAPNHPTLSWERAQAASAYDIYLWPEDGVEPTSPKWSNETVREVRVSNLEFDRPYNWRVVAKNINGETEGPTWSFTVTHSSDLVVRDLVAPDEAVSGNEIELQWTVENAGDSRTRASGWQDIVYLVEEGEGIDHDNTLRLGTVNNAAFLDRGEEYRQQETFEIPLRERDINREIVTEGTYDIIVVADGARDEAENDEENNATRSSTLQIQLPPLPDLVVTSVNEPRRYCLQYSPCGAVSSSIAEPVDVDSNSVAADSAVFAGVSQVLTSSSQSACGVYVADCGAPGYVGQKRDMTLWPESAVHALNAYTFSWDVTNEGDAPADENWVGTIFYQQGEGPFDVDDAVALAQTGAGSIAPGETITVGMLNPVLVGDPKLIGDGHFYVITNSDGGVFEGAGRDNNLFQDPTVTGFRDVPPSDLEPVDWQVPSTAASGDSIEIDFAVRNNGPNPVEPTVWTDRIYLSQDEVLDTDDAVQIGRAVLQSKYQNELQADATYRENLRVRLPDGLDGSYFLHLFVDGEDKINELVMGQGDYEDNNFARSRIEIDLAPYPDLVVAQVDVSGQATAGNTVLLEYTVENTGPGTTERDTTWLDQVYLSESDSWNGQGTRLETIRVEEKLVPGRQTYRKNRTIRLPADLDGGTYFLHVVTDHANDVYEHAAADSNNVSAAAVDVEMQPRADLSVSSVNIPAEGVSGEPISVTWRVENTGAASARVSSWTDYVYLSTDDTFSGDDVLLDEVVHAGAIPPGTGYDGSDQVVLPDDITGERYVLVVADGGEKTKDRNREDNTRTSDEQISIELGPRPDLRVDDVTVESTPTAGQPLQLSVTVTNAGEALSAGAAWQDAWTLSSSTDITRRSERLLTEPRTGPLDAGGSYTAQVEVDLPIYTSGNYYLINQADSEDQLSEGGAEDNNVRPTLIDVSVPPPVDLVVENVQVPSNAHPGETVTISYDLVNQGDNPAEGVLYDAVYVSSDDNLDTGDPRLGIERRAIDLQPSQSAHVQLTVVVPDLSGDVPEQTQTVGFDGAADGLEGDLPGLVPGDYRAIIWTDVRNNIREEDDTNNRTASSGTIAIDIPQLQLDVPTRQTVDAGRRFYYQVDVDAGKDLRLTLENADPNVRSDEFELYVSHERSPTPSDYDAAFLAESGGTPQVLLPETEVGTYYVLLQNPYLLSTQSPDIDILAETFGFSLLDVTPDEGGNSGRVVATITGAQLDESTEFFLERDSDRIVGRLVHLSSTMEAEVRFDLRGEPLGSYDLLAERGSDTAKLQSAFDVAIPIEDQLRYAVSPPPALFANGSATFEITITNENNIDLDVVALYVLLPGTNTFTLTTDDFTGPPWPDVPEMRGSDVPNAGIPVSLRLPESGAEFNDRWGIIPAVSPGLRTGRSLRAQLHVENVEGEVGDLFPMAAIVQGFSEDDFLEAAVDAVELARPDVVSLLRSSSDPADRQLAETIASAPPSTQGEVMAYYERAGLLGEAEPSRGLSLRYEPPADADRIVHGAPTDASRSADFSDASASNFADVSGTSTSTSGPNSNAATMQAGASIADLCRRAKEKIDFFDTAPGTLVSEASPVNTDLVLFGIATYYMLKASERSHSLEDLAYGGRECMKIFGAYDPNDIVGPPGVGDAQWVRSGEPLPYKIRYENDPERANAPARTVVITQPLDEALDLRTFRLKGFGFGGLDVEIPGSRGQYRTRVDVRDTLGVYVDVNMGLDLEAREAFFSFRSIDPATGEPPADPQRGFLPPNEDPPEGDGFVRYTIEPAEDVATGTVVRAQADIIFDNNAPIETPEVFNTIDARPPESRIASSAVTELDTTSVLLRWTAADEDGGSGTRAFTLYAAEEPEEESADKDGHDVSLSFQPVAKGLTDTSYVFEGTPGQSYHFFTVAEDRAGNVEAVKASSDAIVQVGIADEDEAPEVPATFALHQNYPNPFNPTTTVPFELAQSGDVQVRVFNVLGQQVLSLDKGTLNAGRYQQRIDMGRFASGVYFYEIRVVNGRETTFRDVKKFVLVK